MVVLQETYSSCTFATFTAENGSDPETLPFARDTSGCSQSICRGKQQASNRIRLESAVCIHLMTVILLRSVAEPGLITRKMSKLALVLLSLGLLAVVVSSSRIADVVASDASTYVRAREGVPLPVVLWHGECVPASSTCTAVQVSL